MALDRKNLNLDMTYYSSAGYFLTIEEQLMLRVSLPVLRKENNFHSVAFWGKVFGTERDYFIAQGRGKDFIRKKMTFYSLDGQLWTLLFPPTDDELSKFHLVRTKFIGEPGDYHIYHDPSMVDHIPDIKGHMKEEGRLSALVNLVDKGTSIAPRGGFYLSPTGRTLRNDIFRGLSVSDAVKLQSYVHLRLPECEEGYFPSSVLEFSGGDRAIDFLEPIEKDIPEGCWSLQCDEAAEMVTLRNLWWPGFLFYHLPNTPEFGRIYMGFGDHNDDLPFMI